MKISLEGPETIKFYPESEHEKVNLDALWKVIIRCDEDSKVLCPVGEYIPAKHDSAQFVIQTQHG